jgi:hypothetical protein
MSQCMSQSDADAINGDAKAVEAYLKKITPSEMCKITSVKADGLQVINTATCGGGAAKVVTTTYHGDRSDGTDSAGGKTVAQTGRRLQVAAAPVSTIEGQNHLVTSSRSG